MRGRNSVIVMNKYKNMKTICLVEGFSGTVVQKGFLVSDFKGNLFESEEEVKIGENSVEVLFKSVGEIEVFGWLREGDIATVVTESRDIWRAHNIMAGWGGEEVVTIYDRVERFLDF